MGLPHRLQDRGRIEVFNLLGQRPAVLVDRWQSAGEHEVVWEGTGEAGSARTSGIYLCRMRAGGATIRGRMTQLK